MKIFVDLEQTIIDDWQAGNLLPQKIKKIRAEIRTILGHDNSFELNIFSFATLNEHDADEFDIRLRQQIEEVFNCHIKVWTKERIKKDVLAARKLNNNSMDEFEFSSIFGKDLSFILFCEQQGIHNAILWDDTVKTVDIISEHGTISLRKV